MTTLSKPLRNQLEKAVREARALAEQGAKAAISELGVGEARPFGHLDHDEQYLRRALRAHGRQLGDVKHPDDTQDDANLTEEVAYEHWHRMLFARFLAENNLLMFLEEGRHPVPVDLEQCKDLAPELRAANEWELAGRFASKMLPQIFRADSPALALRLPQERQRDLEQLLASLPSELFTASDALGWVYQFWQSKRKEEVNASEDKIGARELPAVTQLFTEPYMVSFLLDNTLGAWWAGMHLTQADLMGAPSEAELRVKAALPNLPLDYLRFVREQGEGEAQASPWRPAAGSFLGWPTSLADFKVLDPSCGSGHFLVALLRMLVPMRTQLEGLSPAAAVDAVLSQNLHGLELDQRCVELAAFALALEAWKYPGSSGYRKLPELNLACSGTSLGVSREELLAVAADDPVVQDALNVLFKLFEDAPTLGSLIDPTIAEVTDKGFMVSKRRTSWEDVVGALRQAVAKKGDEQFHESAVAVKGLAKAAELLAGRYTLVATNVPYLVSGKQADTLKSFCETNYPASQRDLATVFLERCLEFCSKGGSVSLVLPQNWLFLGSYKKLREKLLANETWNMVARLGAGAFETISGEVVKAILLAISHGSPSATTGLWATKANPNSFAGLDVSTLNSPAEKAQGLQTAVPVILDQAAQLKNPDARIALVAGDQGELLGAYSYSFHGLTSGDMPRMKLAYWELPTATGMWIPFQGTVALSALFCGAESILRWDNGGGAILELPGARKDGTGAWGMPGVLVSQMGDLPVTLYTGMAFDNNTAVIIPHNPAHLPAIWCFCSSPEYNEAVRRIDQKLNVTNATLVKVPFDLARWTKVAQQQYPHGLPKPFSDDPTQWIFHGHPCGSVIFDESSKKLAHGPLRTDDTVMQVAVARLLGYRWPAETDPALELSDESRHWVARCQDLLPFADDDGIVCIPPVRGELSASERLLKLLAASYGEDWSADSLAALLTSAGHGGGTMESWLRDKFFAQHCKLFQQRPFIWQVWDGLRDGFSALLNYHKLTRKNLENLIYTYLGDWLSRQRRELEAGVSGAEERLDAATALQKRLLLILEGEQPYDIFVRWKPLDEQPLGWEPDLNDGVRLNIRPFLSVPSIGKRDSGVLRDRPKVSWDKDRGKDVESSPWFPVFGGVRYNDHHLSLAEKRLARERRGQKP